MSEVAPSEAPDLSERRANSPTKEDDVRKKFSGNTLALKDIGAIEGRYDGSREVKLEGGDTSLVHTFTPKGGGLPVDVWGFGQFDWALAKLKGMYVWATYTGMQKRKTKFGEREVHTVDVDYDDAAKAEMPF
jgi:hypothetical protein